MLPLKDSTPRIGPPYAVLIVVLLNVAAFLWEQTLSRRELYEAIHLLGTVPLRFTNPEMAQALGYEGSPLPTLVTHMFLHSGWLHIIGNMWTFWIFADNVEDALGHWRFPIFYLLCGLAAVTTDILLTGSPRTPLVGASGAIAGVLGAYFVLFPRAWVTTLVVIFVIRLPAVFFLGFWFLTQFFSGLAEAAGARSNIAWWAHFGGFVAGIILLPLFKKRDSFPPPGPKVYVYPNSRKAPPGDDPWRHLKDR